MNTHLNHAKNARKESGASPDLRRESRVLGRIGAIALALGLVAASASPSESGPGVKPLLTAPTRPPAFAYGPDASPLPGASPRQLERGRRILATAADARGAHSDRSH